MTSIISHFMEEKGRFKGKQQTAVVVASAVLATYWIWHEQKKRRDKDNNKSKLYAKVECICGQVGLRVTSRAQKNAVHMICYCDHCQHYAQSLRAYRLQRSIVDIQGGTRTCQVYRHDVHSVRGIDLLQFTYFNPNKVPLRPQQMFRAHATCCNTPIISAYWSELPVMGLYASNMKIIRNNNDGSDEAGEYIQVNPETQVWEDDDDNNENTFIYRINCQYALVQESHDSSQSLPLQPIQQQQSSSQRSLSQQSLTEQSLPQQSQESSTTTLLETKTPIDGHPGFPLSLLVRFLYRNYIIGPKINTTATTTTAFSMPQNHKPVLIPSEMKSIPVFPLLDLIFG